MVRWKFEMCPSTRSDNRMYSKPLACSPRCCRGRFEKSCVGIGGQRGSSHSHGSGGVGLRRLAALGEARERPDLHQRLLRPQRPEAVRGRAAVHRQHEVVREAVAHRLVQTLRVELVEVGDVSAGRPVPVHDRVVQRAVPRRSRQHRIGRQLDVAQPFGDAHVVGVHHPGHAVAHHVQVVQLGIDEQARVERRAVARRDTARGSAAADGSPARGTAPRTPLRRASSSPGAGTHTTTRSATTRPSTRRGWWRTARCTAATAARRRRG